MLTGKMCLNVKQCMVCINKLELLDYVLLSGTLLFKGQVNIQIIVFLIRENATDLKSHWQIITYTFKYHQSLDS